ncbi:hypothetical protein Mapa_010659 [Marchantia paleacea]|nr:hypothetical protein Mapa_010659 [Marchantia paleacea]
MYENQITRILDLNSNSAFATRVRTPDYAFQRPWGTRIMSSLQIWYHKLEVSAFGKPQGTAVCWLIEPYWNSPCPVLRRKL